MRAVSGPGAGKGVRKLTSARWGDSSKLVVGQSVVAIGNPLTRVCSVGYCGDNQWTEPGNNYPGGFPAQVDSDGCGDNPGNSGARW